MVEYISGNDLVTNSPIKQQQELLGVDKKSSAKKAYMDSSELADITDISNEALKLYEREKELDRYKKMVLDPDVSEQAGLDQILEFMNNNEFLSPDELADSLSRNKDFMNMLFSE